jgi:membrane-associated protease RseP (regulator of RpoE activity)
MKKIPWLNIILFVLTFFSTLIVGAMNADVNLLKEPLKIYRGLPFSITLLIILLAHEFSHYAASKIHRVEATLPYFLPAPTLFGTLGAFIKMKSPITTKNALMDIGASGPIAGFVVSVIASVVGLSLSNVIPIDKVKVGEIILGSSLLFSWMADIVIVAIPENYGLDIHPIAFAGWIGFLVTSLNLIPVGQLDGGHIAYALLGKRHVGISKVLIGVMITLGIFVYEGWIIWAVLLIVLGFRHPPIIYSEIELTPKRKLLGWIMLVIFIITFIPVPVMIK